MNVHNIKNLLHEFWNNSSDACPLEASEMERQENEFAKFVESKFNNWKFKDAITFIMKWQCENEDPMSTIIVEGSSAKILNNKYQYNDNSFILD